jgi:hypothetical protein
MLNFTTNCIRNYDYYQHDEKTQYQRRIRDQNNEQIYGNDDKFAKNSEIRRF